MEKINDVERTIREKLRITGVAEYNRNLDEVLGVIAGCCRGCLDEVTREDRKLLSYHVEIYLQNPTWTTATATEAGRSMFAMLAQRALLRRRPLRLLAWLFERRFA